MGGGKRVSVFLKGNGDLTDSLLAIGEGGHKIAQGLRQRISELYDRRFEVEIFREAADPLEFLCAPFPPASDSSSEPGRDPAPTPLASSTALFQHTPDVVVFSVKPEIADRPWVPVERFREGFIRLVAEIKERLAAHVIVFNCFAFDPGDGTRNYFGLEDTPALRAMKLNLALIDISTEEGISIVDVDRVLTELGGASHATAAFRYSPRACELIRDEFVRILQDIGFFENRPLVMQMGRKKA